MYYTLQEELVYKFKCLSLTHSPPAAYGPNNIQDTVYQEKNIGESVVLKPVNSSIHELTPHEVAREIVLRRCGQAEPLPFEECYPPSLLRNCFKIGEGVYGEVFLFRNSSGGSSVMKVIPIEGSQLVNGEQQKKFEEILSEIVIAMELSNLRNDKKNRTGGFSEVQKIRCVLGCYPEKLLELWNLYEETRGTENDSPEMFDSDQLYIILELANGGKDMEAFVFKNSIQAYSLFEQTACALAVAESALEFEHRDLHWGNLLISLADKNKTVTYCLNGREIEVPACGIEISIIDFTLSRVKYDGVVIFNDISNDPDLFDATGDYQFEVYKLMQKRNGNQWEHFEPYTNVLWLHYILDKLVNALRYRSANTKIHKDGIAKLRELKDRILKYSSVNELVMNEFAL